MKGRFCPDDNSANSIEFGSKLVIDDAFCESIGLKSGDSGVSATIWWDKKDSCWVLDYEAGSLQLSVEESQITAGEGPKLVFPPSNLYFGETRVLFEAIADDPVLIHKDGSRAPEICGAVIPLAGLNRIEIGRRKEEKSEEETSENEACLGLDSEIMDISASQALLEKKGQRWTITSVGNGDTILNGELLYEADLVFGDRIEIGPYLFAFCVEYIERLDHLNLGTVNARGLHRIVSTVDEETGKGKKLSILTDASLDVKTGEFVAVIGGSGQGKSTLMNALCGVTPPTRGKVWVNKYELSNRAAINKASIGFVPQDDIVHRELRTGEAIKLSAQLKLNLSTGEIEALVDKTLDILDLTAHKAKRVRLLSGGQRKRVNIATELLSSPSVLFLDEPTSGLDPYIEWTLMTTLQKLSEAGMTVVCTTHMLENAHICSRFVIVQEGRIIFDGPPSQARDYFLGQGRESATTTQSSSTGGKLANFSKIFKKINDSEKTGKEWIRLFSESKHYKTFGAIGKNIPWGGQEKCAKNSNSVRKVGIFRTVQLLFLRQWRILSADLLNVIFLFAQAILIGFLIGWVGESLVLRGFLAVVATMWFGCSNGAQQIVGELPIFRRERISGQSLNAYIVSKFVFLGALTMSQALMLMVTIYFSAFLFHNSEPGDPFSFAAMKDGKGDKFEEVLVERLFPVPGAKADADRAEQIAMNLLTGVEDEAKSSQPARLGVVAAPGLVESREIPGMLLAVEGEQQWVPGSVIAFDTGERLKLPAELPEYPVGGIVAPELKPGMAKSPFLAEGGWRVFSKREREKLWKPGATVMCSITQQKFRLPDHLPAWKTDTVHYKATYLFLRFFMMEDTVLDSNKIMKDEGRKTGSKGDGSIGELSLWNVVLIALGLKLLSLMLISVVGVAIGLTISALVQNATQAVLWVPLVLIPQILFGGFVVKIPEMTASVRVASLIFPSYSAQRIMDVSHVYGRIIPKISNKTKLAVFTQGSGETVKWVQGGSGASEGVEKSEKFQKETRENASWQNLMINPRRMGQHQKEGTYIPVFEQDGTFKTNIRQEPDTVDVRYDILAGYEQGVRFVRLRDAQAMAYILMTWVLSCYIIILVSLHRKQTGE